MQSFIMNNSSAVEAYISHPASQSVIVSSLLRSIPVATWSIIVVNVAIFAAGIRINDPVWTLGGQLLNKITKQSKFRSSLLFLRIQDLVSRMKKNKHNAFFSQHKPLFLSTIVVTELPFYAVSNWIHSDSDHLWANMFSLLYFGTRLEYEKGSGFVVLSTFTATLLRTILRAALVQFGRDGVRPLYSYSFLKSLSSTDPTVELYARLGVGFSGILFHLMTVFVMDSSFEPILRIVAAIGLAYNSFNRHGTMKSQIHWGHVYGIISGLCQVAFTKVWSLFVMRKRRQHRSLSVESHDPSLQNV